MADSGDADTLKGDLKQAAGDLTGDEKLKRDAKVDRASGTLKNAVDKVRDALHGHR